MQNYRTLLFLIRDDQILLAMKKRGFGAGRWNGVGGKLEPGETIEQATIRECQEEIGVTPTTFHKVAIHDFAFPDGSTDMQAHTFLCTEWEGDPHETEEMRPEWFLVSSIPYVEMWQDDIFWLPAVLAGKRLHTKFVFDQNDDLISSQIQIVPSFDS